MILKIRREFDLLISGFSQKGSFSRNFAYAFGGKVIIIAFTFLTTPLLTRLYSPEAYGYFSFMNALASNVAIVATLGFPAALVIAANDREFYNLFTATLLVSILIIVLISGVFLLLLDPILPFQLGDNRWVYASLTIAGCFVFAFMHILPKWNIWRNEFRTGARINVMVSGSSRVTSLLIGFMFSGYPFGLIIGDITGKVLGLAENCMVNVRREWTAMLSHLSWSRMRASILRFRRYPYFILTGGYVALLGSHIPVLVFPYFFDAASFGNYALATGLVAIPGILLATPLSSIFLKKVVMLREEDSARVPPFVKRILYALFAVGVLPFAIIVVFGPEIFTLAFGSEWLLAGTISSILAVFALVEMLQITVQNIFQAYSLEDRIFRYSLVQLILVILLIIPGLYLKDALLMIWGFTVAKTVSALLTLGSVLRLLRMNYIVMFTRFVFVFTAIVGILIMLKKSWLWVW